MTTEASIDFESRSGTDIGLGLPAYISDPEFSVLCLVFDLGDMLGRIRWTPGDSGPLELFDHIASGGLVRGWNVMFEWHVWNLHCVPVLGWPPLPLAQCRCTMAEAQALNLPAALGKCGEVLQIDQGKLKAKRGKALIMLLCVPQIEPVVRPLASYRSKGAHTRAVNDHARWLADGGRWINDPALLAELYGYCEQDVLAEQAIKRRVRRLSRYEHAVWIKTQEINLRGVPIDRAEIKRINDVIDAEQVQLDEELAKLTGGDVEAGSQVARLTQWINARLPDEGLHLRDMKAETVDAALLRSEQPEHRADYPGSVVRALRIRSQVGQTSTAKLPKMLQVGVDGTLKNMHVYHGASTGRDASKGGINLQNLKSPIVKDISTALAVLATGDHELARATWGDQLMDAAVSCVRGTIKAPPGQRFIDADYSSIENRVSAWIAGQDDKLDLFRKGLDEYKTFAVGLFDVAYEAVTPAMRKFSKPGVLGGMFGQGARGLVEYAAGMGVFLTLEKAQAVTDHYRAEYSKVRNLWYRCGDAAVAAVKRPGEVFKAGNKLRLKARDGFLCMELPSGRVIAWAAPRIEDRTAPWCDAEGNAILLPCVTVEQTNSVTHQWHRDDLIGSSIFQSAVQGTARDLLMHGVFNVENNGYRVVLRVHDELLSCQAEDFGSPDEFGWLMCQAPEWAHDLPLAFEAWADTRFRK